MSFDCNSCNLKFNFHYEVIVHRINFHSDPKYNHNNQLKCTLCNIKIINDFAIINSFNKYWTHYLCIIKSQKTKISTNIDLTCKFYEYLNQPPKLITNDQTWRAHIVQFQLLLKIKRRRLCLLLRSCPPDFSWVGVTSPCTTLEITLD